MVEIREIQFTEYMAYGIEKLGREHAHEVEPGLSRNGIQLAEDVYRTLEANGALITFGAFEGEELVGYSVAILGPHLHYGFTYAHHDMLYLDPAYRKGGLGLQLIQATEAEAKARGARCATWHAKPGSALQKILDRLGYASEETVHIKEF